MKKIHILGIVIIAVCLGFILTGLTDSSTYASFAEAEANPGKEYHVIGKLSKEKPTSYDPIADANLFSFYMKDTTGLEKRVMLYETKPQDFERSEQIVIIGKIQDGDFHARKILLKCPSKYNDGKPGQNARVAAN
jgi:cytochrome c-type biogenesis protein CcmE